MQKLKYFQIFFNRISTIINNTTTNNNRYINLIMLLKIFVLFLEKMPSSHFLKRPLFIFWTHIIFVAKSKWQYCPKIYWVACINFCFFFVFKQGPVSLSAIRSEDQGPITHACFPSATMVSLTTSAP